MEFLKELFTEPMTFEQFAKSVSEKGYKIADLSTGEYVSKGKLLEVCEKNKTLSGEISALKEQALELEKVKGDSEAYKLKVLEYENKENERTKLEQKAKEDEILSTAIIASIGDKKFINEYTKNSIVAEIKSKMLAGESDVNKVLLDITKDKDGIFSNPNPLVNILPVANVGMKINAEQFQKMGYTERAKLKNDNPDVYAALKGE